MASSSDPRVIVPHVPAGRTSVWHQYTVLLAAGIDREAVAMRMAEGGVDAGVYYPRLVWDYDAYRGGPQVVTDATPRAADMAGRCLSLPVHPGLVHDDVERVAVALLSALS